MEDANLIKLSSVSMDGTILQVTAFSHGRIRSILEHYIMASAHNMIIDHTIHSSRRRRNLVNHPSINFLRVPNSISNLLHLSHSATGPFSGLHIPQLIVLLLPVMRRFPRLQLATPLSPYQSGGSEQC